MSFDAHADKLTLGIVGAGIMGRGIAQIAAQSGVRVLLFDTRQGAAREAFESIQGTLDKLVQKGKISSSSLDATLQLILCVDSLQELSFCNIVIEAIVEKLDAKHQLFKDLEAVVPEECILATNTSSLSVTEIAAACRIPGRVAGYHFFNPVPLMKLVEVIDGLLTYSGVGESLVELARRMGHTPVRAKDTPGFIVNHAGRGFVTESLRILGEGIAEHQDVDRIMRQGAGFRMGPFELLDLTALDVSHPAMEAIYNQYYQEPRLRPSPIARQRLIAGLLGRKTKQGFYAYTDGTQEVLPEDSISLKRPAKIWVSPEQPDIHAMVSELVSKLGGTLDTHSVPAQESLCIVMPLGSDATTSCLAQGLDPRRTIALETICGLNTRRTLMTTPVTTAEMKEAAQGLFGSDNVPVTIIHDSAGFVAQRVLAVIVNIGCDIVQQRITSPEDLDRAVTLGLGYPKGPLAWGDELGPKNILAILTAMSEFYGDPRYRPSPWLTRRAKLGISLLTPEN
ncbi:MAG: 3-hydroxyacyl-CoA dehydrogenase [Planctomycetes bacterium GWF2_50_10]|nr:MAG: 3-hydroxyacyl-CoA dehydrogenase [Planctomycetes bacterium GWF2_50_10]